MAPKPTLARRAHARTLTAVLTLALIALPAQARADGAACGADWAAAELSAADCGAASSQPRGHGRTRARRPCSER